MNGDHNGSHMWNGVHTKLEGKRREGRQRKWWIDSALKEDLTELDRSTQEVTYMTDKN